ncbi:MAG: tripartite tricarboxylate transporter substrate binding protein [Betaproteobacteria bacterium]|nr:tripartite tricarboxylate transporter substrate binding protein [Betaproteobacteria bacterium]
MKPWSRLMVLLVGLGVPVFALSQSYPSKPVRFIIPFAPGGGADLVGRLLGQKLTDMWGQPVVIDNRPGAGANIAAEISARAAPDGYTVFQFNIANAIAVSVHKKLAAVTQLASSPFILVGHPGVNAQNIRELVALAKSSPGSLSYASSGKGGPSHLLGELFYSMAQIDVVHVPYKSVAPAMNDLLPGRIQLMFVIPAVALPHIKTGRLRAYGISTSTRSALAPDIPTIAESAFAGFEGGAWYGMVVPTNTPPAIIAKLAKDIIGILRQPDVHERLSQQGVEVIGSQPAEFAQFIKTEISKFARVVATSGARFE